MDRAFSTGHDGWLDSFMKRSLESYVLYFFQEIDAKKSLYWYRLLKCTTFSEKYLFNVSNFKGARLKFLARTGCLGLGEDKERWCMNDTRCCLCGSRDDTIPHFFITCPGLADIRFKHLKELEKGLIEMGKVYIWHSFMASSVDRKLSFLLGVHGYNFSNEVGDLFDITCKMFLVEAWQCRRDSCDDPPA